MYNVNKIVNNVSINIYSLRKEHKMTARELGMRLGKSECAVTAWERGEKHPSLRCILQMCNIFSCSLEEFFAAEVILN